MKRLSIVSILIIIVGLEVKAQYQTYTQEFDSLFSNVSYGTVTSGISLTTYNNWKIDLNIITR